MKILYAATLRPGNALSAEPFQKIKLVATDQIQALRVASQQAELMGMEVVRVEELESIGNKTALHALTQIIAKN